MADTKKKTMTWKMIVCPKAEDLSGRIAWLDFLKGVSMIAVVIDHLYYSLGGRMVASSVHPLTFFSVTMFIFLAGITAALSYDRHQDAGLKGAFRRMPHIVIPYVIATAVYHFFQQDGGFNLTEYLRSLVFFSASLPFYFIFFFLQLMLISPLLYWAFCVRHRDDWIVIPVAFLAVSGIGFWCNFCTEMLPLHGGGRCLFGGFFLIVFALGFLFYRFRTVLESLPGILLLTGAFVPLYILFNQFWRPSFMVVYDLGMSANPPGLYIFLYTFMIFWGILLGFKLIDFTRIWKYSRPISAVFDILIWPIRFCGKHSLIIFLYHMLAIGILLILLRFIPVKTLSAKILFSIFALIFATAFPLIFVLAGYLWKQCIRFLSTGREEA